MKALKNNKPDKNLSINSEKIKFTIISYISNSYEMLNYDHKNIKCNQIIHLVNYMINIIIIEILNIRDIFLYHQI